MSESLASRLPQQPTEDPSHPEDQITPCAPEKHIQIEKGKRFSWRSISRSPSLIFGLVISSLLLVAALGADFVAPYNFEEANISNRHQEAFWTREGSADHWLGTDHVGRDILSRIIFGGRTALLIGISATLGSMLLGVTLGLIAGYYGGWAETLIMRAADVQWSFPYVVLAIALAAIIGPSVPLIIFVLAISGWVSYGRVVRTQVKSLKTLDFMMAARAIGAKPGWIMLKHFVPNLLSPILVISTFEVAANILAESSLSFLGLGVQPPNPTWGGMIKEGKEYIFTAPWLIAFPGLAISLTVLGINQLGDGLRDLLDPHLRGRL